MRKFCFKTISVALAIISSCLLVSCKKPTVGNNDSSTSSEIIETQTYLVQQAHTDYKILISATANEYETYAAEELQLYMQEATGAEFAIVDDKNYVYESADKILSVGRTSALIQSGITIDKDKIKDDGFIIRTQGNAVLMCGGADYGTLYSVYEFLHRQIDWEPYAVNEIYYKHTVNLKLLQFDLLDNPAIDTRCGGWYYASTDPFFSAKWRCYAASGTMLFNQKAWFGFPHALNKLVSISENIGNHPDWFAASGEQPCFTNQEYQEAIINALKDKIVANPSMIYFPIGLEDVEHAMCKCADCVAEIDAYTEAGLLVRWTNKVAETVLAWAKESGIERDLYFPLLAYYETYKAPAVKDSNGNHKPIDESCVLNKNSPVLFAPIGASHYFSWDSEMNASVYDNLMAWKECSHSIMPYFYISSNTTCFEWMELINTAAKNFQLAESLGAVYLMNDYAQDIQGMAFLPMIAYVVTKLQWDPWKDTNVLVDNFITRYYKEAQEELREYYYLMKIQQRSCYQPILDEGAKWPRDPEWVPYSQGVMDQAIKLLRKGIEDINNCEHYTKEQKDIYIQRIELELLTPLVYILDYCHTGYSAASYLAIVDEVEMLVNKYGIPYMTGKWSYSATNEEKFAEWRGKVS